MVRCAPWLVVGLLYVANVGAETVQIEAQRDATLIEDPAGGWANGAGPWFFAGHTDQDVNGLRRGLLHFDVAAALPENAVIQSVSLTLYNEVSHDGVQEVGLHRVLGNWGEGASFASGGGGAPAEPGDATWIHSFYDSELWKREGGWFVAGLSASTEVGGSGFVTWSSTPQLLKDVRLWLVAPGSNFGWMLVGNEFANQTVKRFGSRENPDPERRPVLEIDYRLPGKP